MLYLYIALIICIIIYLYYKDNYRWAAFNGRRYFVAARYGNSEDAARLLDRLNADMLQLLAFLKKKYVPDEDPAISPDDRKNVVVSMLRNYNTERIFEHDPCSGADTSYTINKGEQTYVCVRDRDAPQNIIDYNTILFVMLHELSHIGAYDVQQHPERFWIIFKFILGEAVAAGIYQPVNYANAPVKYCGMNVSYNPLFDTNLRPLL